MTDVFLILLIGYIVCMSIVLARYWIQQERCGRMTDRDKLKYLHEHQKDMDRDDYKTYWHWYRTKLLAEVMLDKLYEKLKGEVEE